MGMLQPVWREAIFRNWSESSRRDVELRIHISDYRIQCVLTTAVEACKPKRFACPKLEMIRPFENFPLPRFGS
ncbi:hypothetical protein Mapa_001583 [Marchantia paleacea]|nr:hypothetical protein Mapa_001583 [Marchantia paleacea]